MNSAQTQIVAMYQLVQELDLAKAFLRTILSRVPESREFKARSMTVMGGDREAAHIESEKRAI